MLKSVFIYCRIKNDIKLLFKYFALNVVIIVVRITLITIIVYSIKPSSMQFLVCQYILNENII
jgi:hypothetical protein